MKRFFLIILAIFVMAITIYRVQPRVVIDEQIGEEIQAYVLQNKDAVDLHEAMDFEFTEAYLFEPYTTRSDIEQTLGVDYKGDIGSIDVNDTHNLLVFKNGDAIVKATVISRQNSHFTLQQPATLVIERVAK